MIDKLRSLFNEYTEASEAMANPEIYGNPKEIARLGKKVSDLEPFVELFNEYESALKAIEFAGSDIENEELQELAALEAEEAEEKIVALEEQLKMYLIPKDEDDDKSVILEVRAGTGGEEAALFAGEVLRMYIRFAEEKHWKTELMTKTDADSGGIKEASCKIDGVGAYGLLKFESGVHRVQRIPSTESKGRIHTSAATVAILPEAEEVDVQISEADLQVDVYRSSGPGGQSVNTTDSAVRLTHLPTGTVITCQDEKSQLKNKNKAMNILRSRLYALEKERLAKERGDLRSGQIGTGDRSEKIRTYNYPQDRVTDHRIGKSFNNLPGIIEGDLQGVIDELLAHEMAEKLEKYT